LNGGPDQSWGSNDLKVNGSGVMNGGTDYQQRIGSLIVGDFMGDGKQRIFTADHGEGVLGGTGGWHIYTVNDAQTGFDKIDLPYSGNSNLPSQLDVGVPNVTCPTCVAPQYSVMVGDFDGDGRADIAFIDQPQASPPQSGDNLVHICLSRMKPDGTGTFDCQAFNIPYGSPTPFDGYSAAVSQGLESVIEDGVLPPYQSMFLGTQGNGRVDLLLWNPADVGGSSNQRCGYVAPSGNQTWSWSCASANQQTASAPGTMYPGIGPTMNTALDQTSIAYSAEFYHDWFPTFTPVMSQMHLPYNITNNSVISAMNQRSFVGDFLGTGQNGFVTLRPEQQVVNNFIWTPLNRQGICVLTDRQDAVLYPAFLQWTCPCWPRWNSQTHS
jgi:hypothetical protein